MKVKHIPTEVLEAARQLHKDEYIEMMSPAELFDAWCRWNGIIGMSVKIWSVVSSLQITSWAGEDQE